MSLPTPVPPPEDPLAAATDRAERFVQTHGRLLERHLFARLFRGGPLEPVLAALAAYRNPDGGYGHGLEPDKRDPASQPVDAEMFLRTLDLAGALEGGADDGRVGPTLDGLLGWLERVAPDGALPFAFPSVRAHPHAPWWAVPDDPPPSLNPTAAVAGLLRRAGVRHPWLERSDAFCRPRVAAFLGDDVHTALCVATWLGARPDAGEREAGLERLLAGLRAHGLVADDPETEGYVFGPLAWAPTPDAPLREGFPDEALRAHLAARAAAQAEDGGWTVPWPTVSPGVEMEWRGRVTVETLRTLHAYAAAGLAPASAAAR